MVKLDYFWCTNKEWYHIEDGKDVLNDDAPLEAKESFLRYTKQCEDIDRRTGRWLIIPKKEEGIRHYHEDYIELSEEDSIYEDELILIVRIIYDEYKVLFDNDIDDYLEEPTPNGPYGKMKPEHVIECIRKIEALKASVPNFYQTLIEAEKYGLGAEYTEEHIL